MLRLVWPPDPRDLPTAWVQSDDLADAQPLRLKRARRSKPELLMCLAEGFYFDYLAQTGLVGRSRELAINDTRRLVLLRPDLFTPGQVARANRKGSFMDPKELQRRINRRKPTALRVSSTTKERRSTKQINSRKSKAELIRANNNDLSANLDVGHFAEHLTSNS